MENLKNTNFLIFKPGEEGGGEGHGGQGMAWPMDTWRERESQVVGQGIGGYGHVAREREW